jgi:hypothetical protein
MKSDKLDDYLNWWSGGSYVELLAKAVLLDKVSIVDGRITVKAFKEDE